MEPVSPIVAQRFATLDAYLQWLRDYEAPVDGAWYEEVEPNVFVLRSGLLRMDGPAGQRRFTRDELERQFGFKR